MSLGGCHSLIAWILRGSVATPSPLTICPRYRTSFWNNSHFPGLSLRPAVLSRQSTSFSLSKWLSKSGAITITSSKYNNNVFQCRPCSTCSISRWKVAGAEVSPKGKTFQRHKPFLVVNADFSLASSSRGTCQYPLVRSRVLKYLLPARASRLSSILGMGYASCWVTAFSRR